MRNVVFLRHPDPGYRGFLGGVDFYNGRGSTTDPEAVCALQGLGCVVSEPETPAPAVSETTAPPVQAKKDEPEAPREFANRKDREQDQRTKARLKIGK